MELLTVADFEEIYEILENSFPENERRGKERQRALFSDGRYRVYGKKEDGRLVAFIAVWELSKVNFIEHFAVSPSHRGKGMGRELLLELTGGMGGRFCLEVEPPDCDIAKRRIAFYERCGFFFHGYDYTQPPMDIGREAIPLRIMTSFPSLSENDFKALRDLLYREIYKVI
ncbi:MAG: GNAT family N-acetyltransferase [Clostridia bacterium]|nr:GNAT family N-acetyltransferase [Clostridia bacterium]